MEEGKRVLVCDDERHLVRLIQSNLARQGYAVACAYREAEAIALLRTQTFDQAVLDRDMVDLLAWIRGNESTRDLPVTLLGRDDPPGPSGGPGPFAGLVLRG